MDFTIQAAYHTLIRANTDIYRHRVRCLELTVQPSRLSNQPIITQELAGDFAERAYICIERAWSADC